MAVAKRLVVIGGSSGGLDVIRSIATALPADFPAAVCVVLHVGPDSPGILDTIIGRSATLPTAQAATGMRLEEGRIYVAPPDHHLLVEPGLLRITKGPKENRFRPAIDPLFRSAAQVYGPAVIGVVVSGSLDDGTAGLWTIKRLGGTAIVQDPEQASFPSMPRSAAETVDVDYVVPAAEIAPLLVRLAESAPETRGGVAVPDDVNIEVNIAREQNALSAGVQRIARPSSYACPDCHGVLLRLEDAHPLRFRCHTGHAYSAASLVAAINDEIEDALWSAMRTLEEGGMLLDELAQRSDEGSRADAGAPSDLSAQAAEARRHANMVRDVAVARGSYRSRR